METWIHRSAKARVRNQLIAWTVCTVVIALIFIACNRYWANFFGGPYATTAEQLAQITDVGKTPHPFVSIESHKNIDTGVQEITTEKTNGVETGKHQSAEYYVAFVGESALIVKAKPKEVPGLRIEGELKPVTDEMLNDIADDPAARNHLYKFYLDSSENYRTRGFIALACLAVWCVLLAIFGLRALRRSGNIALHPAIARAEAWANAPELIALAEREKTAAPRIRKRGVTLTDHFCIVERLFIFDIYPLERLVWAYLKTVTTRYYGIIPIGKRNHAILTFYGGVVNVQTSRNGVMEILNFLSQRAPWATFGYTQELQSMFKTNQAQFTAAVEQCRAQIMGQSMPLPQQQPAFNPQFQYAEPQRQLQPYGAQQQQPYGTPQPPTYGQPQQPPYGNPQQPPYGQLQPPAYGQPNPNYPQQQQPNYPQPPYPPQNR